MLDSVGWLKSFTGVFVLITSNSRKGIWPMKFQLTLAACFNNIDSLGISCLQAKSSENTWLKLPFAGYTMHAPDWGVRLWVAAIILTFSEHSMHADYFIFIRRIREPVRTRFMLVMDPMNCLHCDVLYSLDLILSSEMNVSDVWSLGICFRTRINHVANQYYWACHGRWQQPFGQSTAIPGLFRFGRWVNKLRANHEQQSSASTQVPDKLSVAIIGTSLVRCLAHRVSRQQLSATSFMYPGYDQPVLRDRVPAILSDDFNPDVLVLQCAGNDIANGHPVAEVGQQLDYLVHDIKSICPDADIIVNKIAPRGHNNELPKNIETVNEYIYIRYV